MAEHTPGPWALERTVDGDLVCITHGGTSPDPVIDVGCGDLLVSNPADAALIAAAPEMLEALKLFMDLASKKQNIEKMLACGLGDELIKASDAGIAALRKAEGAE